MASIKECFTSRFSDGVIMECDFSQLEVIGAAIVSGDPMMKQDIMDGIDSHSQSASWLHPEYTYQEIRDGYLNEDPKFTKMRKNAKAPRFELQYGARAPGIARNNGLALEVAQGFIDRYYARYCVLKQFQDNLLDYLEKNRRPAGFNMKNNYPAEHAEWQAATGRLYRFTTQPTPDFMVKKGIYGSISPTQVANWPMQGFATGDVVPLVLGELLDVMVQAGLLNRALLVNTIHDSIILDVRGDSIAEAAVVVKTVMESAPELVKKHLGVTMDLPFNVDVEVGATWEELRTYHIPGACHA